MAKKKGGKKGGKKKKGPAIFTADEDVAPFGLRFNDIVSTPMGLTCTVAGVKYDNADTKAGARLMVTYAGSSLTAPLGDAQLNKTTLSTLGYTRGSEAQHIRRDVARVFETNRLHEEKLWGAANKSRWGTEALDLAGLRRAAQGQGAAAVGGAKRPTTAP